MSPFLQLAFELAIILLAAKAAGFLSTRLGQPSVLGELLVGVLLGPSLINILGLPFISSTTLGDTIAELSELGVLLLMFIAGLELHLSELTRNRKVSLLSSAGGLLLSIGFGWGAGRIFGMSHAAALLMGLALASSGDLCLSHLRQLFEQVQDAETCKELITMNVERVEDLRRKLSELIRHIEQHKDRKIAQDEKDAWQIVISAIAGER